MGGMPMHPDWAMKLQLEAHDQLHFDALRFELEEEERDVALGFLPRESWKAPRYRRSRGPQAHRTRRANRNHISRRTRRKHRRAA